MPYLHWETSKRRAQMAGIIQEYGGKALATAIKKGKLRRQEFFDVVQDVRLRGLPPRKPSRLIRTPLGKYLLQIAKGLSDHLYFCVL